MLTGEYVEVASSSPRGRKPLSSGLPFIKSIDEFDFTFQPKLNRQKVMSLFDLTFIRQKGNIIFLGPPGVGKTHLANMEDLVKKLKKDYEAGRPGKGRSHHKSAMVIVDEVGYTPSIGKSAACFSGSLPTDMKKPAQ